MELDKTQQYTISNGNRRDDWSQQYPVLSNQQYTVSNGNSRDDWSQQYTVLSNQQYTTIQW